MRPISYLHRVSIGGQPVRGQLNDGTADRKRPRRRGRRRKCLRPRSHLRSTSVGQRARRQRTVLWLVPSWGTAL